MESDRLTGLGWSESPELERRRLEIENEFERKRRALEDERAEAIRNLDEMVQRTWDAVASEKSALESELLDEEVRRREEDRIELQAFEKRLESLSLNSLIERAVDRVTGFSRGVVP
ncbi:MAG: hypothetical protein CSA35_03130 [Dethiosulfovibrio peptidovorans]|nr:MAG: hypothetical protein CSA35_03130 [Dethiosulfovibrio peptidovorans]